MKSFIFAGVIALISSNAFANNVTEVVCESSYQRGNEKRTIVIEVQRSTELGSRRELIFREGESRFYKSRTEKQPVTRTKIAGPSYVSSFKYTGPGLELVVAATGNHSVSSNYIVESGEIELLNRNLKCDLFVISI